MLPKDKMSYFCIHCNHHWIFRADVLATDKQVEEWFKEVVKEHLEVCPTYRKINE